MKFELSFNMDNAAFDEYPEKEVDRILMVISRCVTIGYTYGNIRDFNGNTIGTWNIITD